MNTKNILKSLVYLCFVVITVSYTFDSFAQSEADPKDAIVVKDYIWGSGGRGQPAILREITLKNTGIKEYKNIEIELELYTSTDTPQGSLRATIRDILPAGSEKTYYNIQFGIMHSGLEKATARIVRAEEIEKGTPTHPRHLLIVKDWEFSGGQYGTEGILKSITIENRSNVSYKDIKIKVSNLGVSGPKVGAEGYTSIVVIHNFIPAKTTKTFENINIGFRHPEARRYSVYVMDAKKITEKELRYKTAEKEKIERIESKKEGQEVTVVREKAQPKSSLAERYREKLEQQKKETAPETQQDVAVTDKEGTTDTVSGPETTEPEVSDSETGEQTTAEKTETVEVDQMVSEIKEEEQVVEEVQEEEVPLPKYDIVVRSFKWGSGVPGTMGVLESVTLENVSGLNYTRIHLLIEYFSPTDVPLGSSDVKLYETLRSGETKTFEDIEVGIVQLTPESRNMKITVKDASVMKR